MIKLFLAAVALFSIISCGFFSVAFGLGVANWALQSDGGAFIFLGAGFLVSFPLALFAVGSAIGVRVRLVAAPLVKFFSSCFLAGIAFDLIRYPFGFKLIGLVSLLLLVGLALGRRPPFVKNHVGVAGKSC
jgi:hypothetical protein